ncbi:MAG: chorismate mutase, partial [Victivallales bacterium]|nr:chorismate mutase [Victivallales bacterium]
MRGIRGAITIKNDTEAEIVAAVRWMVTEMIRHNGVKPEDVKETIKLKDKRRANYYNYHSDTKWGDAANYHISLDSSFCGIER